MRIHLDTNLLVQEPNWDLLPSGNHELFVSAISYAEFTEGIFNSDPEIATAASMGLIDIKAAYGDGLPFGSREAEVYREVCATLVRYGRSVNRSRRMDMMIASIAVSNGAALATRNATDFAGLEEILKVIEL